MGALSAKRIEAARIVVVMPNWLGDGVMATPFLRGLRKIYPHARIAAVARPLVAAVCEGLVDEVKVFGKREDGAAARWMRGEKIDLGVLLPNSFRSAWMMWRGRVKRRLGYARGGRSILLTDRVTVVHKSAEQKRLDEAVRIGIQLIQFEEPICDGELMKVEVVAGNRGKEWWVEHRMRSTGNIVRKKIQTYQVNHNDEGRVLAANFQPVPTIEYYLELLRYLKGESSLSARAPLATAGVALDESARVARRMELSVSESERREAEAALRDLGFAADEKPVIMVPGANFGASKCWMPDRFAAVSALLADPAGAYRTRVILAGSPAEMEICETILKGVGEASRGRVHVLGSVNGGKGVSIGALKEIVRGARMMVCNDTGPRHIAAAFGVPVVTLFGPTDPIWAETFFEKERIVRVQVPCGPCQLKTCPIDHRCMKNITVEMVMARIEALWKAYEV